MSDDDTDMLFLLIWALHFFRFVPKYLLPRGMQVAELSRRKRKRRNKRCNGGLRRSDNDPLQTFDDENINLDGLACGDATSLPDFEQADERNSKRQKLEDSQPKIFASTADGTGTSTAGRNAWKAKHRKGKFSGKKRKSERKKSRPLGM